MSFRPLVRRNGRTEQLPLGDTVAGVPVSMPAFQASSLLLKIPLTTDYSLPVLNASGVTLYIPVITNG